MRKHIVIDRRTGQVISSTDMPDDVDPAEFLRREMHDCPECRAALEAGEQPVMISGDDLDLPRPRHLFSRPRRWRNIKRRR